MTGARAPGPDGLRIAVRLTPRSARDAIAGLVSLSDGRVVLAARVRAVPEGGRANAALVRLIADALGVPRSRVALVEGATSRVKLLLVAGDGAILAERFDALEAAVRP